MKLNEFEHIKHKRISNLKVFLVQIQNTTPHHWHSDMEVFLILEGSFMLYTSSNSYSLSAGDIIVLNSYEPHRIVRLSGKGLLLALQYSPQFCASFFPALGHLYFLQTVLPFETTYQSERKLLVDLAYRFFQENFSVSLDCIGLLSLFNSQLIKNIPYQDLSQSQQQSRQIHIRRLQHILDYIGKHYTQKLLLSDVATHEKLSMNYLSHFFTEQLGMNFQDYVKQLRFEKALELLTQTNTSLLDICVSCGFSDSKYLNRAFVQYLGCTPSEYRRTFKEHKAISSFPYFFNAENSDEKTAQDSLEILCSYFSTLG